MSHNPSQVKKQIALHLENNPKWKVMLGSSWICPYCAKVAVGDLSRYPDPVPRVYRHLSKDCPAWNEGMGRELSHKEIKEKIFYLKVRDQVKKNLSHTKWNFYDLQGRWYCPYCAQPQKIKKGPVKTRLPAILKHLHQCFAFEKGKGSPKSESYLRKLVEHEKKVKQLENALKSKLKNEPQWKQTSPLGGWVCPLCKNEQTHIDVSNPLTLTINAPTQIAQHLISSCTNFTPEAISALTPQPSPPQRQQETSQGRSKPKTRITNIPIKESSSEDSQQSLDSSTAHIPMLTESDFYRNVQPPEASQQALHEEEEGDDPPLKLPGLDDDTFDPSPPGDDKSSTLQLQITSRSLDMLPLMPDAPDLEFQYVYEINSSSNVDFLDYITVSETEVGIILINIERSMPTPMILEMKEFIQTVAPGISSPKEFLQQFNNLFLSNISINLPMRISYIILDTENDILRLSRAGHNPLVLFNPSRNRKFHVLKPRGEALAKEDSSFLQEGGELRVKLKGGDLLVAYSNGLLEVTNKFKEEFGEKQLYQLIYQYGRHEAEYFRHKLMENFQEFLGKGKHKKNLLVVATKFKS